MNSQNETICPVCGSTAENVEQRPEGRDGSLYDCPNCGSFFATRSAIGRMPGLDSWQKALISHLIWKNQNSENIFKLYCPHIDKLSRNDLPGPDEQLENFIYHIGKKQGNDLGGSFYELSNLRAKLGSLNTNGVAYIIKEALDRNFIKVEQDSGQTILCNLSFRGWEEYRKIERGITTTQRAFMAMSFSNKSVTKIVDDTFRPAVEATGFKLHRVDDEPRAGMIDDHIRVDIRMSRFVIADLTDGNNGAYWEAGYAEGLGKPVIYTCSKSHFDKEKTHFDTNHHHTVIWDPDDPDKAAESLKATIRATFPFEAKMPEED